jgi:tRNA dimethylallyltransferase
VRPVLTVIAGPTASGKTALALEVAGLLGAEIVSADSQQVYRHFDIGTAKPSAQELALVPHHLVSCVDPSERFSAAQFQALADQAISDITARGRRVVVVGGTGLYLRVLLRGVVEAPAGERALRAALEEFAAREGNEALHGRLRTVDPETAERLPPGDRVRVIRALEIHALTGVKASEHRARHGFASERYGAVLWVLAPERELLYRRINERARAMFEGGLLEEARWLCGQGLEDTAPMRAVGYVQALACLRGAMTKAQAVEDTAQKTRHYAKRQLTWFRKEPGAHFVAPPYLATAIAGETEAEERRRSG